MGLKDMFDSAVKKPVTKTDDLGQAAVSMAVPVQVPIVNKKKSVLASSYALGRAAVSKIDKSVRNDEVKQKLKKYLPSYESREKIVQALTHPATQEALNLIVPGGTEAANYLVESVLLRNNQNENDIDEQNKYEHVIQQLKVMQAEIEKLKQQLNELVMTSNNYSSSTVSEQKPEDHQKPEEDQVIT